MLLTNASCETKYSTAGLMKIVGILSYPAEQSFQMSFKYCATSSYKNSNKVKSIFFLGRIQSFTVCSDLD